MKKIIAILIAGTVSTPALAGNQAACLQITKQGREAIEELVSDGITKYHFQSVDQFPPAVKNLLNTLINRLNQDIEKYCKS
jgi:hypothetical protein